MPSLCWAYVRRGSHTSEPAYKLGRSILDTHLRNFGDIKQYRVRVKWRSGRCARPSSCSKPGGGLRRPAYRPECIREKLDLERLWVRGAVEGRWFGKLRWAAQVCVQPVARDVTGVVSYRLEPDSLRPTSVVARKPFHIRVTARSMNAPSPRPSTCVTRGAQADAPSFARDNVRTCGCLASTSA